MISLLIIKLVLGILAILALDYCLQDRPISKILHAFADSIRTNGGSLNYGPLSLCSRSTR